MCPKKEESPKHHLLAFPFLCLVLILKSTKTGRRKVDQVTKPLLDKLVAGPGENCTQHSFIGR